MRLITCNFTLYASKRELCRYGHFACAVLRITGLSGLRAVGVREILHLGGLPSLVINRGHKGCLLHSRSFGLLPSLVFVVRSVCLLVLLLLSRDQHFAETTAWQCVIEGHPELSVRAYVDDGVPDTG